MVLQHGSFFKELDRLQQIHGDPDLRPIYGAGCIKQPKFFFLLMNPTARNISAFPKWQGIRAPWLGTKNIWKLLFQLRLLSKEIFQQTQSLKPNDWTRDFCKQLYQEVARNKVYLTSLAKCTQLDARPLPDRVFRDYLEQTRQEIHKTNPQYVISFGNQVSSLLLGRQIKVSAFQRQIETLEIGTKAFRVAPTFYPVGQGMRNMNLAVRRIQALR